MLDGTLNIPADTVDVLFGHVEALLKVNCQLLLKFEADRGASRLSALISSAFVSLEKEFEVYLPYCNGYTKAVERLNHLIDDSPQFNAYLEVCKENPDCRGLDLISFLIKPGKLNTTETT